MYWNNFGLKTEGCEDSCWCPCSRLHSHIVLSTSSYFNELSQHLSFLPLSPTLCCFKQCVAFLRRTHVCMQPHRTVIRRAVHWRLIECWKLMLSSFHIKNMVMIGSCEVSSTTQCTALRLYGEKQNRDCMMKQAADGEEKTEGEQSNGRKRELIEKQELKGERWRRVDCPLCSCPSSFK